MTEAELVPPWFIPQDLNPQTIVCDLFYQPSKTVFLSAAAAQGCPVQNGLPMLLYQGALSFTWWTGLAAPVAVMRQALMEHLSALPRIKGRKN